MPEYKSVGGEWIKKDQAPKEETKEEIKEVNQPEPQVEVTPTPEPVETAPVEGQEKSAEESTDQPAENKEG